MIGEGWVAGEDGAVHVRRDDSAMVPDLLDIYSNRGNADVLASVFAGAASPPALMTWSGLPRCVRARSVVA